jgi:hypothetical protein
LGVSISLLFVQGQGTEETLKQLNLVLTEERRASPIGQRGIFLLATLPSGFQMIWSNTCDERRFSPAGLVKLSETGEVLVGRIEEHVMFSQAELWQRGNQIWEVKHFGDFGDTHLETIGHLPTKFEEIRKEQDARNDYFEIAVRMMDDQTGYRYDKTYDWEGETAFTVLRDTAPKKTLWKIW